MSDRNSRYGRSPFRIHYTKVPVRPFQEETLDFLCDVVEIGGMASVAQLNASASCVFITMETEDEALSIGAAHAGKHPLTQDGKKYPVDIALDDESTEVFVVQQK
uniref:RRM domain-containing protein n=1 Tax=Anopheles farauti TaxID=69004 RepID=A0A182QRR3_9DIPT